MKRLLLFVCIILCLPVVKSTTYTITNNGNSYSPATLTIAVGDSVLFVITTSHDAREVSATTWNSNGNTALSGGFQTSYGGGTVTPAFLTLGTHYYVCTPHAYLGMKGTITVVSCLAPAQPGTITGSVNVCSGVPTNYSIAPISGATSYSWSLPGGWTGSSTTNTISVTAGTTAGAMTVVASNTCGTSGTRTLAVSVFTSVPAQPSSIAGNSMVCSSSFNVYQVGAVAGAQSYSWSLPSGWSGSSQVTGISSVAGNAGGLVTVYASNVCGLSPAQTLSVSVTSGTALAPPLTLDGNTLICANSAQVYTISPVTGATSYSWTFPAGFLGAINNTLSNSVTSGTNSGLISVTANNICGASAPKTLSVTISVSVAAAPSPLLGNTVMCSGVPVTISVAPVPHALTYSWSIPGSWTGTSTTNVLTFTPGVTTGSMYVWALNACGSSPANLLVPVVSTAVPTPGPIVGNTLVCPNSAVGYSISPVPGALEYMWMVPSGWTGSSPSNFFGGTVEEAGGNIMVHVSNGCGEASQTLAVTVHTFQPYISVSWDTPHLAFPVGESYQWLDCQNGLSAVPDATLRMFDARVGTYAVLISQFGCVDTSDCVTIPVGLAEIAKDKGFFLFPNPAVEEVILKAQNDSFNQFVITNVFGQIVRLGSFKKEITINVEDLSPGVYFVTVPGGGFSTRLFVE